MGTGCSCSDIAGEGLMRIVQGSVSIGFVEFSMKIVKEV
jgi:hypothetical protein